MIQETFPMIVGEEEVLNERELLVRVESGLMMDSTDSVCYIILHCSATRCNSDYTVEQLLRLYTLYIIRKIYLYIFLLLYKIELKMNSKSYAYARVARTREGKRNFVYSQ